jgi:hypothetical protein
MSETDDILKSLDDKESEKKPSKAAPKVALFFADFIFFILDVGSGLGVYWLTGIWYYGVIVFLAGFVPLVLHQKLYTQPFASRDQKRASMVGIIVAISSVLIVALFTAVINFAASISSANAIVWMEVSLAVSLVLLAFAHALITAYYFYIDEEVSESQRTNRIVARGQRSVERIAAAAKVARAKQVEVRHRKKLEGEFSPEIIAKILEKLRDSDGDGIPDFIDPVDNRKVNQQRQYASNAHQPPKERSENPTQGGRQ